MEIVFESADKEIKRIKIDDKSVGGRWEHTGFVVVNQDIYQYNGHKSQTLPATIVFSHYPKALTLWIETLDELR